MCLATGCEDGYEFQPELNTCAEKVVISNKTEAAAKNESKDEEGQAALLSTSSSSLPKLIILGVIGLSEFQI